MGVRDSIATALLNYSRKIGEKLGCNLAAEVKGDRLVTTMEVPDNDKRAWDPDMMRRAGLFISGYANEVKPTVHRTPNPKEPDELDVESNGSPGVEDEEFDVIPSYRYQQHQDQHVLSELVNPSEQWRTLVMLALGIVGLQFFTIIVTLYATGSF